MTEHKPLLSLVLLSFPFHTGLGWAPGMLGASRRTSLTGSIAQRQLPSLRCATGSKYDGALPRGWVRVNGTQTFSGAGVPGPDLRPEELPALLMTALELNDAPRDDAGLTSMWHFAGGNTKHVFQQNMTEFIESAHKTANALPTSFYGVSMHGRSWEMETDLNRVGGDDGWIATQVMKTVASDGRVRRWQWELRKNRRPPCLGCWLVEAIGSSDRKGNFEPE